MPENPYRVEPLDPAPRRRSSLRFGALGASLAIAAALTIAWLAYEMFGTGGGIPYQDPTPEQIQEQLAHAKWNGALFTLVKFAWLGSLFVAVFHVIASIRERIRRATS